MLDILETAAKSGGEVLQTYFLHNPTVTYKTSHKNIVTQADLESQEIIKKKLIELCEKNGIEKNKIGFIGEENLFEKGEYTFIIDPIDGTSNFACGLPYFCISIALSVNGQITHGVVYDPHSRTVFGAALGQGAYALKDGVKRTLLIEEIGLKEQFASIHYSSNTKISEEIYATVPKLLPHFRSVRTLGSITLELCHTADNIFGIIFNGSCYIWDIAAAGLIVNESGGVITDWSGNPLVYDLTKANTCYKILAGHRASVSQVVSLLNK